MNGIDLVVYLVLALAVWDGWRRGVVMQLCSLAGIVAGIWFAARYGAVVGAWLRLDPAMAAAGGFVVVLLATMIAVALLGRALRKLFRFAGFGLLDILLGIAVSVVKYLLILSVLFAAFDRLNEDNALVSRQTLEESRWFRPVTDLSGRLLPFLDRIGEYLPSEE